MTDFREPHYLGTLSLTTSQMQDIPATPWQVFEKSRRRFPDNYIIYSEQGSFTYQELYSRIQVCSQSLSTGKGIHYGLYLPNSPEFILALFSLNCAGKIIIPLPYSIKPDALESKIIYADIDIIITHREGCEKLKTAPGVCRLLKGILLISMDGAVTTVPLPMPRAPGGTGRDRPANPEKDRSEDTDSSRDGNSPYNPGDLFGICFTSGTTASPRGVMITNPGITGNALEVRNTLGLTHLDRFLVSRSCAQAGPIAGDILSTVAAGGALIMMGDFFHPGVFFHMAELFKATCTLLVGTTLSMVLHYPRRHQYDISDLTKIIFGGMKISETIVAQAIEDFPTVRFYCTYGLTEAGTRVCFCKPGDLKRKPGSVGKPIHGCEVIIRAPDGRECVPGRKGRVHIVSSYVMAGYYKLPELSHTRLTSRGLVTNDIGFLDKDGSLYICGRSDDVIIQGGYNILPAEIEDVLVIHPGVAEVVAFGVPDTILGRRIVAFVTPLPHETLHAPGLMKWCRSRLEESRMPREVYILDELPKDRYSSISRVLAQDYYTKKINGKK